MSRRPRRGRRRPGGSDSGTAPGAAPSGAGRGVLGGLSAAAKVFAIGLMAIALSTVAGALVSEFEGGLPLFVSIVVALGAAVWAFTALGGVAEAGDRAGLFFGLATLLVVVTPNVMAWSLEHRLFGTRAYDVAVGEATRHPFASVFTFRDARVRPDLGGDTEMQHGRVVQSHGQPLWAYAAPVVPEGWTAEEPVGVWAVATNLDVAEARAAWALTAQSGVRVIGLYVTDYQHAIAAAKRRHRLNASLDSVLVEWTANPDRVERETWWRMGRIVAVAAGVWLLLILATALVGSPPPRTT